MIDPDLTKYAYLWQQQRHQIALFTVTCYGCDEYLIYHIPTKRISLVANTEVGKKLVAKLMDEGVPLLKEAPEFQCYQVSRMDELEPAESV